MDLPSNSPADLERAREERALAYKTIKQQATELANTRVVSDTKQTTEESTTKSKKKKKKNDDSFKQKFTETVQVTSAADVEVKPISESTAGKILKTEIEIRVSPVAGVGSFSPTVFGANELFSKYRIRKDQKYLVTIKKEIYFDEGNSSVRFYDGKTSAGKVYRSPQPDLALSRSSLDLAMFAPGSFIATLAIDDTNRFINFVFKRGGEEFTLSLYYVDWAYAPTVTEFLSDISGNKELFTPYFRDFIDIKPAFQFKPRIIGSTEE